MSLTASSVCDEDNRKQEVIVLVHKLPKRSSSGRNYGSAAKQNSVHIKEDARLRETDRETDRSVTVSLQELQIPQGGDTESEM